jgi:uncharacterized membrane protein
MHEYSSDDPKSGGVGWLTITVVVVVLWCVFFLSLSRKQRADRPNREKVVEQAGEDTGKVVRWFGKGFIRGVKSQSEGQNGER